jgi:hypothetical protein
MGLKNLKPISNLTHCVKLSDFCDKEIAGELKKLYLSKQDLNNPKLACLINSAITCHDMYFFFSCSYFLELIKTDPNLIKKTFSSHQYGGFVSYIIENGIVNKVKEPIKNKNLGYILEIIDPDLVSLLLRLESKEYYEEQKNRLISKYNEKAGLIATTEMSIIRNETSELSIVKPITNEDILPIKDEALPIKEEVKINIITEVIPTPANEVNVIKTVVSNLPEPEITADNIFDIWFADLPHYKEYSKNSEKNRLMEQLILMFKGNDISFDEALSYQRKVLDVFFSSAIKSTKKDWVTSVGNSYRGIATKIYLPDLAVAEKPTRNVYKKSIDEEFIEYKTSEEKMLELDLNIDLNEVEKDVKFRFSENETFDSPEAETLMYKRVFAYLKKSFNEKQDKQIEWDLFQTEESFSDFPISFCPTTWGSKIPVEDISHLFDFTGWILQSINNKGFSSNMLLDRQDYDAVQHICLSGKVELGKKWNEEEKKRLDEFEKSIQNNNEKSEDLNIPDWEDPGYKPSFEIKETHE